MNAVQTTLLLNRFSQGNMIFLMGLKVGLKKEIISVYVTNAQPKC